MATLFEGKFTQNRENALIVHFHCHESSMTFMRRKRNELTVMFVVLVVFAAGARRRRFEFDVCDAVGVDCRGGR